MHPTFHVNWIAVLLAIVASFVFGWLWYGPLFGKKWAALMKFPADMKPDPKVMMRGMVMMVIGAFLTSYTVIYVSDIWRPSVWGGSGDGAAYGYALATAFWVWLGFYVPQLFQGVAWEGKGWPLFGINAAHAFLNLLLIAMIIQYVR